MGCAASFEVRQPIGFLKVMLPALLALFDCKRLHLRLVHLKQVRRSNVSVDLCLQAKECREAGDRVTEGGRPEAAQEPCRRSQYTRPKLKKISSGLVWEQARVQSLQQIVHSKPVPRHERVSGQAICCRRLPSRSNTKWTLTWTRRSNGCGERCPLCSLFPAKKRLHSHHLTRERRKRQSSLTTLRSAGASCLTCSGLDVGCSSSGSQSCLRSV